MASPRRLTDSGVGMMMAVASAAFAGHVLLKPATDDGLTEALLDEVTKAALEDVLLVTNVLLATEVLLVGGVDVLVMLLAESVLLVATKSVDEPVAVTADTLVERGALVINGVLVAVRAVVDSKPTPALLETCAGSVEVVEIEVEVADVIDTWSDEDVVLVVMCLVCLVCLVCFECLVCLVCLVCLSRMSVVTSDEPQLAGVQRCHSKTHGYVPRLMTAESHGAKSMSSVQVPNTKPFLRDILCSLCILVDI